MKKKTNSFNSRGYNHSVITWSNLHCNTSTDIRAGYKQGDIIEVKGGIDNNIRST